MTKPTSEPSDPICPTCKKPITDEDAVMHHNCLPPSEPRVELLTTNETSSKPVVPEPNQKPPSGPPREWTLWFDSIAEDGGIWCGKPEDYEAKNYVELVGVIERSAYDSVVAERDALRLACEMLAKVLESVELYPNGHTNMRVKAALAQYEALKRQLAGEEK